KGRRSCGKNEDIIAIGTTVMCVDDFLIAVDLDYQFTRVEFNVILLIPGSRRHQEIVGSDPAEIIAEVNAVVSRTWLLAIHNNFKFRPCRTAPQFFAETVANHPVTDYNNSPHSV